MESIKNPDSLPCRPHLDHESHHHHLGNLYRLGLQQSPLLNHLYPFPHLDLGPYPYLYHQPRLDPVRQRPLGRPWSHVLSEKSAPLSQTDASFTY